MLREGGDWPPLTPLPSADTMRALQIEASIHYSLPGLGGGVCSMSSRCGTDGTLLPQAAPRASSFLPPFPPGGFASRPSATTGGTVTMKALTPGVLTQTARSLRLTSLCLPGILPPTTRSVRWPLCQSPQRQRLLPGFAARLPTVLRTALMHSFPRLTFANAGVSSGASHCPFSAQRVTVRGLGRFNCPKRSWRPVAIRDNHAGG
jgi:hypothetical protein